MIAPWNVTLLEELEARAAARRVDGTYPPDLDATLRADVDQRLQNASTHTTALRAAVAQLRALGPFEVRPYRGTNRAKALYATVVQKAFGHAVADLVRQLEAYRIGMERVLDAVIDETEPVDGPGETGASTD